jgi:D-alanyl-D-alanine carboxypeptidase
MAPTRRPGEVVATVISHWGRFGEVRLTPGTEPPQLAALTMRPVTPPNDAAPPRVTWPGLRAALTDKLADDAAYDWFSGAVSIWSKEAPLFEVAQGYADRERQIPNTLETRFRVGSMNKMFTGVAVLQLVQSGRIGLDEPVARYLPTYPNRVFAETVTVRHLLTHTGGAGDFFGDEFMRYRFELRDPSDYIARFGKRDPQFEPGSEYRYANYGFILLGRLVEAMTGWSYDDFVAANIFAPAGMTSTGALPETADVPNLSIGYIDNPAGLVRNDKTLPYRGTPAGGGYSTVGDLISFAQAVTSERLLDAAHTRMLTTGVVEAHVGKYAMGFAEFTRRGGVRSVGHNGGAPGMNGALMIVPEGGYIVAVLANRDPPQADSIADFILQRAPLAT